MHITIKNVFRLRKILWWDTLAGGSTAIVGLLFSTSLVHRLGLPEDLIVMISAMTLLYAVLALMLAVQKRTSIPLMSLLVYMNWVWTIVSVGFLFVYAKTATTLGVVFLGLQIVVVGSLAYAEGKQLIVVNGTEDENKR